METDTWAWLTSVGGNPVAGDAEVPLTFLGGTEAQLFLYTILVKRRSGTSVTPIQPRVYATSGDAVNGVSQRFLAEQVAAGTLVHVTAINRPTLTDATGKLYLKVGGDASDLFDYEVWAQV